MAEQAYLTTRGIHAWNPNLFDELVIPSGMNRELLIFKILEESGNMEVLYPQPEYFKRCIGFWSRAYLKNWQELYDTTQYEYDPISNYDRKEERTYSDTVWENEQTGETGNSKKISSMDEDGTSSTDTDETGNISVTDSGSQTVTSDSQSTTSGNETKETTSAGEERTSSTTTETISAYNSNVYEPSKMTTATGNRDTNGSENSVAEFSGSERGDSTQNTDHNRTERTTKNLSANQSLTRNLSTSGQEAVEDVKDIDRERHEETAHSEKLRAYGNIGVTTTQQMIEAQREVVKFNIYDYITRAFIEYFCIMVY